MNNVLRSLNLIYHSPLNILLYYVAMVVLNKQAMKETYLNSCVIPGKIWLISVWFELNTGLCIMTKKTIHCE